MSPRRQFAAAILLGLFVRAWRGFSMLDPFFFIPFACLSAILAGPALVELQRKDPAKPIQRHIRKAVLSSCGAVGLMLAVPLIALNFPWYDTWLLPQTSTIVDAVLLSLTSATAAAALTALFMKRVTAGALKWIFRVLTFGALVIYRFALGPWSSTTVGTVMEWGVSTTAITASTALLIADGTLLYLLTRRQAT